MDNEPEWLIKVGEEAKKLPEVLFSNFKYAMECCIKHCPDPLKVEQRARVFERVVQVWIGGLVNPIATFANTSPEIEEMIIQEVRLKFDWIRKREKDLALQQLDSAAQSKKGPILVPST